MNEERLGDVTATMERHHADSIRNLVTAFEEDESVQALVLGGSLAHGFARPDSDIDVTIVVSTPEYERRKRENRLHYNDRQACTYDGYIDGKYVDLDFLRLVAARGSEPARFAYQNNRVLFSRVEGLDALLATIARYPVAEKQARIDRFAAQLMAFRWYYSEGLRQANDYLVTLALQKVVLFGARVVLAENELLFPFHKWMLRVLEGAERRPPEMLADVRALLSNHSRERVEAFCRAILAFVNLDFDTVNATWPSHFMRDTELTWVTAQASIDDI